MVLSIVTYWQGKCNRFARNKGNRWFISGYFRNTPAFFWSNHHFLEKKRNVYKKLAAIGCADGGFLL